MQIGFGHVRRLLAITIARGRRSSQGQHHKLTAAEQHSERATLAASPSGWMSHDSRGTANVACEAPIACGDGGRSGQQARVWWVRWQQLGEDMIKPGPVDWW